jgi:hypothetical protein
MTEAGNEPGESAINDDGEQLPGAPPHLEDDDLRLEY